MKDCHTSKRDSKRKLIVSQLEKFFLFMVKQYKYTVFSMSPVSKACGSLSCQ